MSWFLYDYVRIYVLLFSASHLFKIFYRKTNDRNKTISINTYCSMSFIRTRIYIHISKRIFVNKYNRPIRKIINGEVSIKKKKKIKNIKKYSIQYNTDKSIQIYVF